MAYETVRVLIFLLFVLSFAAMAIALIGALTADCPESDDE